MHDVQIDPSWKQALGQEFTKPYWEPLTTKVRQHYQTTTIYPPPADVFRAFNLCPFDQVKVVIVGQDPYHGPKQANGLSFAVHNGIALPPSLKNIYKEIESDLNIKPDSHWANQGVLMLNSVLTVQAGKPASHAGLGWEKFTDAAIYALNAQREHIVYMLWGRYAQRKGESINRQKNLVLESAHPSPLAGGAFFGNHHFSQCNEYLSLHSEQPIDWH